MANKVTIDVEARFIDHVSGGTSAAQKSIGNLGKEADKAQKRINELSKKPAKPIFDADNNRFLSKVRSAEEKMKKLGHTKTAAVLDVIDKGSVKIGKLINKAQSFARKTWQSVLKIKDSGALSTIRKITSAAESFGKKTWTSLIKVKDAALAPINAIKNALFSIPNIIQTVIMATVVKKAVIDPINLADQYTSAQIGFSTLLGESAGQDMMDQIDIFAKKTPFKTSGVIENTQKMMAYGWDAERIIEDLETIGDAAAATGKGDQGLESIVRALAEIRSKGKLSTQELNQLAGAGIKAKAYLAEGLGYGSDDAGMNKLAEDLEAGAIGANQAIDLILGGMKQFKGMMDKTANETVGGLKSQIEDAFEINVLRRWGQGLQDGAKKGFGSFVSLLDEADEGLAKIGDMLFEIGSVASNWAAGKLENAFQRIKDITETYEFENATWGEKASMLWKGVVVDPLKEWWDGGGREKAAEIGRQLGEALSRGIVSVLGNVWDALPWWAKAYVGGKAISGVGNMIGGIANMAGAAGNLWNAGKAFVGTPGTAMIAGTGLSSKLASLGFMTMGGAQVASAAGVTGTTAALAGLGSVAGGAGALYGGYKAAGNLYDSYQHAKAGDKRSARADFARGLSTTSGILAGGALGAKAGTAVGSIFGGVGAIPGALIGAGIGAVGGMLFGDAWGRSIEAAKYESEEMAAAIKDGKQSAEELEQTFEKAKWENAKKHFGDIKLSMDEIARLADQVVWGDDLASFDKFVAATKNAKANLLSMKNASQETNKWMWKAGLGVKFNDDEKEAFAKSVDEYITSAASYLENAHYEFAASAELLLDVESETGKSILESGNAFYTKEKESLTAAGEELGNALTEALADGIINADEEAAILAAQEKIAKITERINNAEAEAEMELIKVKWGQGNLDYESFEAFMASTKTALEERMASADEAFEVQVRNLKLRYPDGGAQYEKELATIVEGYEAKVESVKAEVMGVELEMIGEAYTKELGADAAKDLQNALEYAMENDLDPITISGEKLAELLNVEELSGETAGNIKEMLSGVFDQMGLMEVDGDILLKLGEVQMEEAPEEKVKSRIPDRVSAVVDLLLSANEIVEGEVDASGIAARLGVPEEKVEDVLLKINGIPVPAQQVEIACEAFGISKEYAEDITWKLTGIPNPNKINLTASSFGIQSAYTYSPTVNISPNFVVQKYRGGFIGGDSGPRKRFRGGIVGGSSAAEKFARGGRPDDGILDGTTKFIMVNEESPEMIIPLSSQRRGRALKLWAQAGNIMGVPGFARGGITGGGQDEGIRFNSYGSSSEENSSGSQSVQIDVGGITFEINANGNDAQSITETIKAQASEIAETIAGVLADSLGAQFENTPTRGGVS